MLAVITKPSDLYVTVSLSMRHEVSINAGLYHHSSLQHKVSILGIKGVSIRERNNDIQFILFVAETLAMLPDQISPGGMCCVLQLLSTKTRDMGINFSLHEANNRKT